MNDELREEYQFDYSKAKANRFTAKLKKGGRLVVLDPGIAPAFPESQSVNGVLKLYLQSKPKKTGETVTKA
jgi:hypothetical protein